MAAFVPRALAKPQKVPLPGKLVRKVGGLVDKRGVSKEFNATGKPRPEGQVDAFNEADQTPVKKSSGGVTDRASSNWQASFSGRGNSKEEIMGFVDHQGLRNEDDGPEVLQIEKHKQQAKRRRDEPQGNDSNALETVALEELQASKKRRGPLDGASSPQETAEVAMAVERVGLGQSAKGKGFTLMPSVRIIDETVGAPAYEPVSEPHGTPVLRGTGDEDLHSVQLGAGMIENDGRGGDANGVVGKGAKKQGASIGKKVFPYGNYNRYYGYRFAKTLSEDPRLSVFQKEWFQGKACLDVGCNEGYVTIAVAQKFECGSMVGVDIDGSLVAKAKSHLKREAAILRQASKPQRARLDLAGQADHPGVRQTLLGGTQSRRSPEGALGQEKQQQRRRLAHEDNTGQPSEVDTSETDRGDIPLASSQASTAVSFGITEAGGADVIGRDAEGGAGISSRGASGGADVSTEGSGRDVSCGAWKQTAEDTLDRISEAQNGELENGHLPEMALNELQGEALLGATLDEREREEGVSKVDRPADDVAGSVSSETSLEGKRFPQNVQFRKENFVASPVEEEKYDVVMSLSVVKWIHLNWGDDGLLRFFSKVYKSLKPGGLFILEPQPWKSYKNNRAVSETTQRHFKEIKILPDHFPDVLQSKIGFRSADIVTPAVPGSVGGFGRAIHLYRK